MKKLRILLCLLISTTPVLAAWTAFSDTETSTHFIDQGTVRLDGSVIKVSVYEDLRKPGQKGELSRSAVFAFQCLKEMFETQSITGFAGNKLSGQTIYTDKLPLNWLEVAPGSVSAKIMKKICP